MKTYNLPSNSHLMWYQMTNNSRQNKMNILWDLNSCTLITDFKQNKTKHLFSKRLVSSLFTKPKLDFPVSSITLTYCTDFNYDESSIIADCICS